MHIDKEKVKSQFKDKLLTVLLIAPTLSILLFSTIYNLSVGMFGNNINSETPIMMSVLTIIAIISSFVLSVIYNKRFVLIVFSVLFILCFICYLGFYNAETTDIYADGFFEMLMLILSIPVWSYMPLATAISENTAIPALIITAIIAIISLLAIIFLIVKEKRGEGSCKKK